jgi:hypothetical protein
VEDPSHRPVGERFVFRNALDQSERTNKMEEKEQSASSRGSAAPLVDESRF